VSAVFEALRGKIRGAGEAPKTSGSHPNLIKSWWKRMEKDGKLYNIIYKTRIKNGKVWKALRSL
jgi:hypothetical protein